MKEKGSARLFPSDPTISHNSISPFLLCLIHKLSCHVVRSDLKAENVFTDFGDFIVCIVRIVCELGADANADFSHLLRVFLI